MPLFLLASSVAHFTVAGSTPNSIARSKVGLLAKTFYWRAIGAIDKRLISETKADTTSRTAEDFGSIT
ncbi:MULTISPECIES: hypothetical protein [unclassified Microcoleus]|uniref:hypothetical protein n=1 Tax=unclassified Microcoleus TaxID=2642155 RepID=UPI002FD68D04